MIPEPIDRSRLRLALAFGLVFVLSCVICFLNLDASSLRDDEGIHVRATQGIMYTGSWWKPTLEGRDYFNKPPLKMWLSTIPLTYLGQENFAYRLIDAAAGVATVAVVFFFAYQVSLSTLCGCLAGIALLGCKSYVLTHGVRWAVQDSLYILLSTIGLWLGYLFVTASKRAFRAEFADVGLDPSPKHARFGIGCAIVFGLAALVKSAAVLIPLAVLAVYALCVRRRFDLWRADLWLMVAMTAIIVVLPGLYYLPHFIWSAGAVDIAVRDELYLRVLNGFHNREKTWFYFDRLLRVRSAVPPELLCASVVWALFQVATQRQALYLFLTLWACVPLLVLTCVPSRLIWYLAPAYPAYALLVGLCAGRVLHALWGAFTEWWKFGRVSFFRAVSSLATGLLIVGLLGFHLARVSLAVMTLPQKSEADLVAHSVRVWEAEQGRRIPGVSYRVAKFEEPELPYVGMILRGSRAVDSLTELVSTVSADAPAVIITELRYVDEVMTKFRVAGYRLLRPLDQRTAWLVVLAVGDTTPKKEFRPATQELRAEWGSLDVLHGVENRTSKFDRMVREFRGNRAALMVLGDPILRERGAEVELFFGATERAVLCGYLVEIFVNSVQIGQVPLGISGLQSERLAIPPGVLQDGRNVIFLKLLSPDSSGGIASDGSAVADADSSHCRDKIGRGVYFYRSTMELSQ